MCSSDLVTQLAGITGPSQFEAIDALGAEEINLADELRGALTDGDRCSFVQLLSALGVFWTIRGEHARLLHLAGAVTDLLDGWQPPAELADETLGAVTVTLSNALMTNSASTGALHGMLRQLGGAPEHIPHLSGQLRLLFAYDPADTDFSAFLGRLGQLADGDDRGAALADRKSVV